MLTKVIETLEENYKLKDLIILLKANQGKIRENLVNSLNSNVGGSEN